jgi:hypothetical protein
MKDIYNPDNEDVLAWLNSSSAKWPASDWDYYVMNGENDDLVFRLANDIQCRRRDFFVHALYYLVGDYFSTKVIKCDRRTRIDRLISLVDDNSHSDIQKWKARTLDLFAGKIDYNPDFWFDHFCFEP